MAGDAPAIYLASASPRRSELLRQIDVTHEVRPVDIDESPRSGEKPAHYALRLAEDKARTLWERLTLAERRPVLAADTTVALGDDILGKPANHDDAARILGRLSGRTHDKNIAQVAAWLQVQGIRLTEVRVVSDQQESIVAAVNALRHWRNLKAVNAFWMRS